MSTDKKMIYSSCGGIGLGTTLFVVFLVLKLCGIIDWSWWWVFAPLWVPVAALILLVILLAITGRIKIISKKD